MANDAPQLGGNAEQIAYWNGPGGEHWTKRQESNDAILAPISSALLTRAAPAPGERIIDVGCGCGETTIALANLVGAAGQVTAVDVSVPMLEHARHRASGLPIAFLAADATDHPFETASADLLFSRFGVMFFADPVVSFANLRRVLRPGGRLVFVCWRERPANPWLITPYRAILPLVAVVPEVDPDDPGPFAFAREDRVRGILDNAGFTSIAFERCDFTLDLALGRGLEAAVSTALEMGPASRLIDKQPPEFRPIAAGAIRKALAPAAVGTTVPLAASVWMVTASNPS